LQGSHSYLTFYNLLMHSGHSKASYFGKLMG
jgi:hypothetical protein